MGDPSDPEKTETSLPTPSAGSQSPQKPTPPPYSAFTLRRRTYILTVVTIAGFFGPLAGNIYLPALKVLAREFNVSVTAINVTVSVFMVVFAFGPLFWSSFADWKGRRPLYIISLAVYILANILLAAVPSNYGALVFLRTVQAFGSSAVVSMGAGTVADTTEPKRRARAMSYFLFGPQCGPILGPVLGGAFAGQTSWRWIFGFLALMGRVGNGKIYASESWVIFPPTLSSKLAPESERGPPPPKPTLKGYWRLFRYPPIGIVSFNTAILYSTYFCIAVQLPSALGDVYHWSTSAVGAGYLVVGIAMVVGSISGGRFSDARRARAIKNNSSTEGDEIAPENRLIDQIWGVILSAGVSPHRSFPQPFAPRNSAADFLLFLSLAGFGMSWVFVATNAFLTECIAQQAAAAFALGNMLRNPGAAIGAVIIHPLVVRMGWGWCFTGLSLLDLILVGSSVILLRVKSPGWRRKRAERMRTAAAAKGEKTEKSAVAGEKGPGG
ncbi:MAG: hypothetical protein Q9227_008818 [Pyrenula ochraceoflavens]